MDTEETPTHNKVYEVPKKIYPQKHIPDEAPLQLIISFLQIDLDSHITHLALLSINGMNKLLHNYGIINAFPSQHKSGLERGMSFPRYGMSLATMIFVTTL